MKEDNVSDLYSSFSDKSGLIMTVGRGWQVSDRMFTLSKGILVGGIKRGSPATALKENRKSDTSLLTVQNMDLVQVSYRTRMKHRSPGG